MSKKKWYEVTMQAVKIVKVFAEDNEDAKNKADKKFGPKWMADAVWEVAE